jgi:large subunit ribosomal protein L10e
MCSISILIFYLAFLNCPARLQTGMRQAYGKPLGLVARVDIGQPIMSVRAKDQHKKDVIESLRRAKFKYPGRQKVRTVLI